jgi:hypothetical protein
MEIFVASGQLESKVFVCNHILCISPIPGKPRIASMVAKVFSSGKTVLTALAAPSKPSHPYRVPYFELGRVFAEFYDLPNCLMTKN